MRLQPHKKRSIGIPTNKCDCALTSKPVLERHHEGAGIGGLVTGEELEDLGQGAEELEHALLKGRSVILLLLLHEVGNDGLALAEVLHGEGADLVEAHHLGHRGEDEDGIELIAQRLDDVGDLLGQLLDEDEGTDEDVGLLDVLLELLVGGVVAELLEEVADALDGHVLRAGVDALDGAGHGGLVLRFQDDVDDLHDGPIAGILGNDAAVLRVGGGEHAASSADRHVGVGGILEDHIQRGRRCGRLLLVQSIGRHGRPLQGGLVGDERGGGEPAL